MNHLTVGSRAHALIQRGLTLNDRLDVANASSIAIELAVAAAGVIAAMGSAVPLAAVAGGAIVVAAGLRVVVSLVSTNAVGRWLRTPANQEQRREALLRAFQPHQPPAWLPPIGSRIHLFFQGLFTWGWTLPAANAPALARDTLNGLGGLLASGVAAVRGMPRGVATAVVGGSLIARVGMAVVASSQVGQWLRAPIREVDRAEAIQAARQAYEDEFGPLPSEVLASFVPAAS